VSFHHLSGDQQWFSDNTELVQNNQVRVTIFSMFFFVMTQKRTKKGLPIAIGTNNASTRIHTHRLACLCRIRQLAEQAGCSTGPTLKINFKDEAGASELGDLSLGIFLNTIATQS
jgi:hypothetical protein